MCFRASSWNISMSSLMILAASFFEISCGKNTQTNSGENSTPVTAVGVGNKFIFCVHWYFLSGCISHTCESQNVVWQNWGVRVQSSQTVKYTAEWTSLVSWLRFRRQRFSCHSSKNVAFRLCPLMFLRKVKNSVYIKNGTLNHQWVTVSERGKWIQLSVEQKTGWRGSLENLKWLGQG